MQEILDRADIGRSTFYTHSRDEDELLIIGFENVRSLLQAAQAATVSPPGKSYERIIGFSLAKFEHGHEYRVVNRALLGSNAEAVVRRQSHSALVAIVGREGKPLMQRQKTGDRSVSPKLLTYFLVSTFVSVLSWRTTVARMVVYDAIEPAQKP